jgi:hypothetical protein
MVERLKNTLKDDLEALKAGQAVAVDGAAPKTPKKAKAPKDPNEPKTPRTPKRKAATDGEDGTPKKRGRPKKNADEDVDTVVKGEIEMDHAAVKQELEEEDGEE